jgi:hypothetical protein
MKEFTYCLDDPREGKRYAGKFYPQKECGPLSLLLAIRSEFLPEYLQRPIRRGLPLTTENSADCFG